MINLLHARNDFIVNAEFSPNSQQQQCIIHLKLRQQYNDDGEQYEQKTLWWFVANGRQLKDTSHT